MVKEFHSQLKTVGGGEGDRCKYPTRLDMYGCGCQHNCTYCYARSLLDFRGLWNPEAPSCTDKRTAYRIMDRLRPGEIVRIGGMTDPFQPIEEKYRLTEWAIGELNKRRIGYLIVTKSALVAKCRNLHPQLAHVQVSYTYTEGKAPQDYERASPPEERIKAAEELHARGYDVQLRLSPLVPEYIDMDRVIRSPIDKVLVEFLRINPFIEKAMPWLDTAAWTHKAGNYRHLPLKAKVDIISPIIAAGKRVTVCEDVPEHYEYWRQNVNHNPDDCCDLDVRGRRIA
jgi:DNA repair photolyase